MSAVREEFDIVTIICSRGDIELNIERDGGIPGQGSDVYFHSGIDQYRRTIEDEDCIRPVKITARDISDYPDEIRKLLEKSGTGFQYVEVGAGLGEYVCEIAIRGVLPKPIMIDPVDYSLLERMLVFAREQAAKEVQEKWYKEIIELRIPRINELIKRCKVIRNPEKVRIYNIPLREASRIEELIGVADVVVDSWGPRFYSQTDDDELKDIDEAELRFLKRGGRLIQVY